MRRWRRTALSHKRESNQRQTLGDRNTTARSESERGNIQPSARRYSMKRWATLAAIGAATTLSVLAPCVAAAQEAVRPATDVDALFRDQDPRLHRNKQAAWHIMNDLLAAGHWDKADHCLTERYIQHNPNVPNGRQAVVDFFNSLGIKPKPVPARLETPVVSVVAEGDLVVVVCKQEQNRTSRFLHQL